MRPELISLFKLGANLRGERGGEEKLREERESELSGDSGMIVGIGPGFSSGVVMVAVSPPV